MNSELEQVVDLLQEYVVCLQKPVIKVETEAVEAVESVK